MNGQAIANCQVWAADPHQYGPGKKHLVDDTDPRRTLCGTWLEAMPGRPLTEGRADCQRCLNRVVSRAEQERNAERYQREAEQRAEQHAEEERQRLAERERQRLLWKQEYDRYLLTAAWRSRRVRVLNRANYVCEACGEARATAVHHKTYEHIFHEPLFDLVAICADCHCALHPKDGEE